VIGARIDQLRLSDRSSLDRDFIARRRASTRDGRRERRARHEPACASPAERAPAPSALRPLPVASPSKDGFNGRLKEPFARADERELDTMSLAPRQ